MRGRKIHFFCDGAAKPLVVGKSAAWKTAVLPLFVPPDFPRRPDMVIDSRPPFALLAAASSITRGREQHEWRPRVDKFLKSFRADILFYPCKVMRRSWGAETTAHRPMFADKHRDRGTKFAMCLLFAVSEDKKQALWQFV